MPITAWWDRIVVYNKYSFIELSQGLYITSADRYFVNSDIWTSCILRIVTSMSNYALQWMYASQLLFITMAVQFWTNQLSMREFKCEQNLEKWIWYEFIIGEHMYIDFDIVFLLIYEMPPCASPVSFVGKTLSSTNLYCVWFLDKAEIHKRTDWR